MAEQTTHFHLSLREAADIFNPLSTNDNFTTIDAKLYDLETKGGIIGYSGSVSANLLTLSGTPTENDTIFKVIPDGDCNTVSFSGAVRQIQAPNGTQLTLKANTLYVCYMSSSAMVALAWPDSVDANTFDGQSASYYATASSVADVDSKADNATQVAQAATTIANNALTAAENVPAVTWEWENSAPQSPATTITISTVKKAEKLYIAFSAVGTLMVPEIAEFYLSGTTIGTLHGIAVSSTTSVIFYEMYRVFTVSVSESSLSITFNKGYQITGAASNTENTSACIPIKIGYV